MPTTATTPTLRTAEEAAEILRVRRSWLERQAAARKIPFTMLGGCYQFTSCHLSEIVQMFEITPVPESQVPAPRSGGRRNGGGPRTAVTGLVAPMRPRPRNRPRRGAWETPSQNTAG